MNDDYYHFDPVGHRLTGERTGMVYRLGDRVRIKVAAVNLDDRKIDFVLAQKAKSGGQPQSRKKTSSRRGGSQGEKGQQDAKSKQGQPQQGKGQPAQKTKQGQPQQRKGQPAKKAKQEQPEQEKPPSTAPKKRRSRSRKRPAPKAEE